MATIDKDLAKYFTITTESAGNDIKKVIKERSGGNIVRILKDVYQTPQTIQKIGTTINNTITKNSKNITEKFE